MASPRDEESEYITSKIDSRGRMGEAWGGATKDWAIVDVPPGTERVRMDGVGGGSQDITWQRYNGVRRSKFYGEEGGETFASDFGVGKAQQQGPTGRSKNDMWTEITKEIGRAHV